MQTPVKTNSSKAWLSAIRPKTLSGALVPVLVPTALAIADGKAKLLPAILCATFALLMQIAANLINDYWDYRSGTDGADRLGPERAMAQGWITQKAMLWGIALNLLLAVGVGIALLLSTLQAFEGSPEKLVYTLVGIGFACIVGAFIYSLLLSYIGLGDILVWLFFGFVPVLGTYYVQAYTITPAAWIAAAACALVIDTLLVLNNYRDRDTDRKSGKHTLVSVGGERFGRYFYFIQGFAGCACGYALAYMGYPVARLVVFYLYFHLTTWHLMSKIREGRELNHVLGLTARNILIFGLLLSVGMLLEN